MAFVRRHGQLHADKVPLTRIAEAVGTPAYVYSWTEIKRHYLRLAKALGGIDHRICYAVKANSNLSVLARLRALGAGFDIVSGGELERVMRVGVEPAKVVFSGVGKSVADIDFAIKSGIGGFNVESASELRRIEARAALLGITARVSMRVNPNVDANAHPYIATGLQESKFGVPATQARELYRHAQASRDLDVVGVDCHIGSQITEVTPFRQALTALLDVVDMLAGDGVLLRHIDIGGGFGVDYGDVGDAGEDGGELDVSALGEMLKQQLRGRAVKLLVEPGRFLVANAGVLLTRVEYLKPAPTPDHRSFAIVDAAMNDLLRPALYQAWHKVEAVADGGAGARRWNIVGPVCESGDFLATDRELAVAEGALLAVRGAGAYGFVQSSNYNSRPRVAEVLVDGNDFFVVRKRETVSDMLRLEAIV